MASTTKVCVGAALTLVGLLFLVVFGQSAPVPLDTAAPNPVPELAHADTETRLAVLGRQALPLEDFAALGTLDLKHPFGFAMRLRCLDPEGLPVQEEAVFMALTTATLARWPEPTDADGEVVVRWQGRQTTMRVLVGTKRTGLREVMVHAGDTLALTLLTGELRCLDSGQAQFSNRLSEPDCRNCHRSMPSPMVPSMLNAPRIGAGLHGDAHFVQRIGPADPGESMPEEPVPDWIRIRPRLDSGILQIITHLETQLGDLDNPTDPDRAGTQGSTPSGQPAFGGVTGTVRDMLGRPAGGVSVSYGLEVDRPLQRTVTDPAGRYRFPMVPVGRAELRAGGRWHGLQTRSVQISHVTETVADLFLELGSTVRGRVHWPAAEEGDPVAEAMVIFEARDGTHADRERVSMQGTFVVPNLPRSPGRLSLQLTNHPFPIAWMDHVIADGGEVEFDLREVLPIHGGLRLRVQEDLEASPGTIEVRVVQIETGHVSFVERMRDGSHTITGLPAGSYRVLVCADVHGSQDLGQFWVDGRRITDLGLRTLPRPAVLGIEHVAPVGWIGPELYLRRPELDLRLWPTQMPEHGELRLPEGIWLALWRDSSGSIAGLMTRLHAGRRSHLVE